MGAMDGVALAKAVRKAGGAMQIVFVTGYSDYIAEGYDVEALNYLMIRKLYGPEIYNDAKEI